MHLLPRNHFAPALAAALLAVAVPAPRAIAAAAGNGPGSQEQSATSASSGGGTIVVPIQGPLSEKLVAITVRAIRQARETGASTIVFELDTSGGDVELMDRLITEFERANDLRTVAFVTQKAASAGALIAISCQRLYMAPASNMGSALPISTVFGVPIGFPGMAKEEDLSPIDEKALGHFWAHFRAKAQAHGRPAALAEAMVYAKYPVYEVMSDGERKFLTEPELNNEIAEKGEESIRKLRDVCRTGDVLNLTAQEALETGMIDGLAVSREDLLEQLGLAGSPVTEITPSWSENLADFTQRFGLLFLVIGLIAVFIELKVPGFGVPGILGICCLAVFLFGKYLAGLAEMTEILLIVAGFALIAVEIFLLPGTILSGALGALLVIGGLVLATQQTLLPQADRPYAEAAWWDNVKMLSLGFAAGVAGMFAVAHVFPSVPILNRAILRAGSTSAGPAVASRPLDEVDATFKPTAGMRGRARTELRPAGKVEIAGRELDAVTEGSFVDRGRPVVVLRVEAAHVVVRGVDSTG